MSEALSCGGVKGLLQFIQRKKSSPRIDITTIKRTMPAPINEIILSVLPDTIWEYPYLT
jgi:hypothetical protein